MREAVGIIYVIAVLALLGFIAWLIHRAVAGRPIKVHTVFYGIACVTGIFTYVFFLGMDILDIVKIGVSILLGIVLIALAAISTGRRQSE